MDVKEPEDALELKKWISANGGFILPIARFLDGPYGRSLTAGEYIPPDTTVATCPFSLAITPPLSRAALKKLMGDSLTLDDWSERQLMCSYMCFHWILDDSRHEDVLAHRTYLNTLPSSDKLRTPLYFTPMELEAFKGTNLFWATSERWNSWQSEWRQCKSDISAASEGWAADFAWDLYMKAVTYLTSRAYPSTLLHHSPSLRPSATSYPVLIPGIDSLNHARAVPVSWVVKVHDPKAVNLEPTEVGSPREPSLSLVMHNAAQPGEELFNNYGPKPNAELILGYGFSLPHNPDDTIVLRIGMGGSSATAQKWEIGRGASGADGLWDEIVHLILQGTEREVTYEDELDAADTLSDMVQRSLASLPAMPRSSPSPESLRPEVLTMLEHYLEGQKDILRSVLDFAEEKRQLAVQRAKEQGVDLVLED